MSEAVCQKGNHTAHSIQLRYAYQSIKLPLKLQPCSEGVDVASVYIVQWCNFLKKLNMARTSIFLCLYTDFSFI